MFKICAKMAVKLTIIVQVSPFVSRVNALNLVLKTGLVLTICILAHNWQSAVCARNVLPTSTVNMIQM